MPRSTPTLPHHLQRPRNPRLLPIPSLPSLLQPLLRRQCHRHRALNRKRAQKRSCPHRRHQHRLQTLPFSPRSCGKPSQKHRFHGHHSLRSCTHPLTHRTLFLRGFLRSRFKHCRRHRARPCLPWRHLLLPRPCPLPIIRTLHRVYYFRRLCLLQWIPALKRHTRTLSPPLFRLLRLLLLVLRLVPRKTLTATLR